MTGVVASVVVSAGEYWRVSRSISKILLPLLGHENNVSEPVYQSLVAGEGSHSDGPDGGSHRGSVDARCVFSDSGCGDSPNGRGHCADVGRRDVLCGRGHCVTATGDGHCCCFSTGRECGCC